MKVTTLQMLCLVLSLQSFLKCLDGGETYLWPSGEPCSWFHCSVYRGNPPWERNAGLLDLTCLIERVWL